MEVTCAPHQARQRRAFVQEIKSRVIKLDDGGDEAINTHGHEHGDGTQHTNSLQHGCARHRAQRDDNDFCRQYEVRSHGADDLVALESHHINLRIGHRGQQLRLLGRVFAGAMQEAVGQLFKAFVTKISTADHQQRYHCPWRECADSQRRRHQNNFVTHRAFGHRPDHGQFARRSDARHLLGVQSEIITQYSGSFFGRQLGHDSDIIEHGRDIVEQS